MSKIELDNITSGYSTQKINANFQKIEDEINNKMLSRNPEEEPNVMLDLLDMNSNRIINLPAPTTLTEPVRLKELMDYAEGGAIVVGGSGIDYVTEMPVTVEEEQTLFQTNTYDLGFTVNDGDSIQILEFSMIGSPAYSAGSGGGSGGTYTFTNSTGTGSTLLKAINPNNFEFKRLQAGTNVTFTEDANSITINSTAGGGGGTTTTLSNQGLIGLPLVSTPVGNDYPIKRLQAGSNITLTDEGTYYTIAAAGTGGVTDGDKGDIVVSSGGASWVFDPSVVTAFAKTLLDDTTAASMRTTLGLGTAATFASTSFQAADATLTGIAATSPTANQMLYTTGTDAFATTAITSLARSLLGGASVNNMLNTLGIIVITNADGTCIKFPTAGTTSGIQICFKTDLTTGSISTASGQVFVGTAQQWNFPVAFSSVPSVMFFPTGNTAAWVGGGQSVNDVNSGFFRGYSAVTGTTAAVNAIAIGTY